MALVFSSLPLLALGALMIKRGFYISYGSDEGGVSWGIVAVCVIAAGIMFFVPYREFTDRDWTSIMFPPPPP